MKRLGDFTAKYGAIESGSRSATGMVQKAIEQVIDIQIAAKSIKITNGTAYIQAHPAIKQVLIIEKAKILEIIKKSGGKIVDVR